MNLTRALEWLSGHSEVRRWTDYVGLQPPERTILDDLQRQFRRSGKPDRLLDLGVGAGRTTPHFADLCRTYVGVDVRPELAAAAARRFGIHGAAVHFVCGDCRTLPFGPESFEVVLFSFNGIDYLPLQERTAALQEIRRVLCRGGTLVFSGHNLNSVGPGLFHLRQLESPKELAYVYATHPVHSFLELLRHARLRLAFGTFRRLAMQEAAMIPEIDRGWATTWYAHVTPSFQLRQLQRTGFTETRVVSLSGQEIHDHGAVVTARDRWLYYVCRRA